MTPYHLAIDIGASSGRHILGCVRDGRLITEEIYRFENRLVDENGLLTWDIDALEAHVKAGIRACAACGKAPATLAIDTWGVDYVLLDRAGNPIRPAVAYRDPRGAAAEREVSDILPQEKLYARTGIQKQTFNTIYQLWADCRAGKLEHAARLLMMPDYLAYRLTGRAVQEYTNATTTGLVNAAARCWDSEILDTLGLPAHLFGPLSLPGTPIGPLTDALSAELGLACTVICAPSHDTASAVAACPLQEDSIYLSSGTWSLIGTEIRTPILTPAALAANFTNEGGVEYRFRFLKNIMGMWLFQCIHRELPQPLSYDERMALAEASGFREILDLTSPDFLAPRSMIDTIRAHLRRPDLPLGDLLSCVYHSLAAAYRGAVEEIEQISGKRAGSICIVGGGSRDDYLNRLTAAATGRPVLTGLTEATAVGNLLAQIMYTEQIPLARARDIVRASFPLKQTV